jgi:hypothetical protein
MEVIPLAGSIQARTGTVQAGNKVKIVGFSKASLKKTCPAKTTLLYSKSLESRTSGRLPMPVQ